MYKEDWDALEKVDGIHKIHSRGSVNILHADNMAFLRWCKDDLKKGWFHVGIVDPPYGIDAGKLNFGSYAKDRTDDWKEVNRSEWDNAVPTPEYWELLRYVCRKIIVWGGNYFSNEIPPGRCFLVWDKMNDKMTFASGELALTNIDANSRIIRRPRNKSSDDDDKNDRWHRTQKPVYLYDYIHLNFVEKGQRVLDTHGGSFTHAMAAVKNNVNLTIMDIEELYVKNGLEKIDITVSKPRLLF